MKIRRLAPIVLLALFASVVPAAGTAGATGDDASTAAREAPAARGVTYQPDGWIKLCGLSTGCKINPPPHPWKGRDIYNRTGKGQKVPIMMQDGEGARWWITVQNDGNAAQEINVKGCKGNRRFVINAVLIGKHKRPKSGVENITKEFKEGKVFFDLDPGKKVVFTLNIVAPTTAEGVTWRCKVKMISMQEKAQRDVVVTQITTY